VTPQQPPRKTIFGIENLDFAASIIRMQEAALPRFAGSCFRAGNLEA